MADPDLKKWSPSYTEQAGDGVETLHCTGKHIADVVESLVGAHFMSNNLRRTLELIGDMGIMPLREAKVTDYFPDRDLTFTLHESIDEYHFDISDSVTDIFTKYFQVHGYIDEATQ